MVLVDYLTLMTAEKADRNDLAYGLITKGLKNLAKELDCVVVLLTQLNRDLEKRTNKRPLPSDSRDTGQMSRTATTGSASTAAVPMTKPLTRAKRRVAVTPEPARPERCYSLRTTQRINLRLRPGDGAPPHQEREEKPNKRGGF
jgi:replicative DNA helicase